ncbi:MAG: hypothetical protein RI911_410 [Candidatus Parcubacteria bacterium]|jgi:hypothetical protein
MSRGEKIRQSYGTYSYTHLRVNHGPHDTPFALQEIEARRPDIVLLEGAGLTRQQQNLLDTYITNPSQVGIFGDPYIDSLLHGLRELHQRTGYAPRVRGIDYRADDKRLASYERVIAQYQRLVPEYERQRMSFTQAQTYTKKVLTQFIAENQKREVFMEAQVQSILEAESDTTQKSPRSQTCLVLTGMKHRRVSDALRSHNVPGDVVVQERVYTQSFIDEYYNRGMYREPIPPELLACIVFTSVFHLFAVTFNVYTSTNEASRNGFQRRVAAMFNEHDMERFYIAMLNQDKPTVMSLLQARAIPTGNA